MVDKNLMLMKIVEIENSWGYSLPEDYSFFLLNSIKDLPVYEVYYASEENSIYLYNSLEVLERNKTYKIQEREPNYFMIGQDGDRGYFIHKDNDRIYVQNLGALGSLDMEIVSLNIGKFVQGD